MSTPTYPLRGSSQPLPHGLAAPGVLGEGPYPRAKSTGPPDASPAALSFLELSTQPYTLEDYLWCLGLTWSAVVAQAVMDPLEKNIFAGLLSILMVLVLHMLVKTFISVF